MIFGSPLDNMVLSGTKTMTRRKVKPGRISGTVAPCTYHPDRHYAVQRHRGGLEVARITILEVRREPVGEISHPDARLEGFLSTAHFADYWMRLHDSGWPPSTRCPDCDAEDWNPGIDHCATCEDNRRIYRDVDADEVLDRFQNRHAEKEVWAIRFELRDPPHLLAQTGTSPRYRQLPSGRVEYVADAHEAESDLGYTTRERDALPDEPEAIPPQLLQHYTNDAEERFEGLPGRRNDQTRKRIRALHERVRRLTSAGIDARLTDMDPALTTIEQHLDLLEQQRGAA